MQAKVVNASTRVSDCCVRHSTTEMCECRNRNKKRCNEMMTSREYGFGLESRDRKRRVSVARCWSRLRHWTWQWNGQNERRCSLSLSLSFSLSVCLCLCLLCFFVCLHLLRIKHIKAYYNWWDTAACWTRATWRIASHLHGGNGQLPDDRPKLVCRRVAG